MSESLLKFPALYPIKVMGENSHRFINDTKRILNDAHRSKDPINIEIIYSRNSNYVSISSEVYIVNHAELHSLYSALNAHPMTKMIL